MYPVVEQFQTYSLADLREHPICFLEMTVINVSGWPCSVSPAVTEQYAQPRSVPGLAVTFVSSSSSRGLSWTDGGAPAGAHAIQQT